MHAQPHYPAVSNVGARGAPALYLEPATAAPRAARPSPAPAPAGAAPALRFWRPLPPAVADVVCGEGTVQEVPLHTHESLQLLLPTSQLSVVDARGRATAVSPGAVHLAAPLQPHAARRLGHAPCAVRVMLVGPAMLARLGEAPAVRQCVVEDETLAAELHALFDDLRGPLVALECESRLRRCLARLLARGAERARGRRSPVRRRVPGVARVRDHLREHVAESVSLDELADVAGLSKFYLLRAFRRTHGLTPHAYQMQLRLARAWRLITDGCPLSRATYDAGFADQSHLTRRFVAAFGLPPGRYARQLARLPGGAPHEGTGAGQRPAAPPSAA
ncbi:MAG TPA: AraC family transcriptional regulator [Gemmatimonadaceae bacterium]|nr:AraC family transcriptional regulator [Gemmatimonadaceae bacterium]